MKHPRILLIDNFDSFTYNLVDYLRQCGAEVTVLRNNVNVKTVVATPTDLVVYSPGPGNPKQSGHLLEYIAAFTKLGKPQFGVCLGLQAIVEAFGGSLRVLDKPVHGRASEITHEGTGIFKGLPNPMLVGRYHSLAANVMPKEFTITARTSEDNVVMAITHNALPISAVQFHPESILTAKGNHGLKLIQNLLNQL